MFVKNKLNLSILIPCYNWNVYEFIHKIHVLCQHEDGLNQFEIICIEDASSMLFANQQINGLQYVKYEKLNKNIGRSRIRNLMAKKAQYEWLLFIDADSNLSDNFFIKKYIQTIQQNDTCENIIFYGGTLYLKEQPEKDKILHWKYGTKIESKRKKECFSSHHFLMQKKIFSTKEMKKVEFNESISSYGYEDVLFIIENKLKPVYIENDLYHLGLKNTRKFISDTEHALKNLIHQSKKNRGVNTQIKILEIDRLLSIFYLNRIIILFFRLFKNRIIKNLYSNRPSILVLQCYKLGYFLTEKREIS